MICWLMMSIIIYLDMVFHLLNQDSMLLLIKSPMNKNAPVRITSKRIAVIN
jgi:hypothetical protein